MAMQLTKLFTMENWLGLKQSPAQLPSPTPQSRGDTEYVDPSLSGTICLLVSPSWKMPWCNIMPLTLLGSGEMLQYYAYLS